MKAYEGAMWLLRYGGYGEGDKLPSERVMSERLGVSRTALRTLVDSLIDTSVIETRHGSGTYVLPKRPLKVVQHAKSFTDTIDQAGMAAGSRVISCRHIEADAEVASQLEISEGDDVWKLVRVRTVDGEPCAVEVAYFPYARFPGLDERIEETGSLVELLRERYGTELVYGYETLSVTLADAYGAALLGIEEGRPCYRECIVDRDSDDVPIEYSKELVRADRYQYASVETAPGFEGELDLSWLNV
jgi:GntR family transcriptional regulator